MTTHAGRRQVRHGDPTDHQHPRRPRSSGFRRIAQLGVRVGLATALLGGGLGLLAAGPASADTTDGYSHDSGIGLTSTDWMSSLPSNAPLSNLSIPATHDSGASRAGGDATLTQSMALDTQLSSGVRGWDIRLKVDSGRLTVYHGFVRQGQDFENDVLGVADRFLAAHPGETLLMRVKQEDDNNAGFADLVKSTLDKDSRVYRGSSDNPLLSNVRGKIVVLQDFSASYDAGIPWSSLDIQDNYNLSSNWDLANKWRAVTAQLNNSRGNARSKIFANFLSGSGGSFPYFVASGHSSPGTGAPNLLTGWTRGVINSCQNTDKCIPEFPSVNCFLGTCSVAFEGTNVITMNTLRSRGGGNRTGIVFADFPGKGLVQSVIDTNVTVGAIGGTSGRAAGLPADLELPAGYTRCAGENETCAFSGTRMVAFGAGAYRYRTATGSTACNTSAFDGDPAYGTYKSCWVAPLEGPVGTSRCAVEKGTCQVVEPTVVTYGANGAFASRLVGAGSIACDNSTFGGDPLPNTVKGCYVAPRGGPGAGWTECAVEWGTCHAPTSANALVTFGANGSFVTRRADGDIRCTYNADGFGSDPIVTINKKCYVRAG